MRLLFRLGVWVLAGVGAKSLYDKYLAGMVAAASGNDTTLAGANPINLRNGSRTGYDTPTGTDPNAKYTEPGYQDKSFGQAVAQDDALVDRLLDESGGDVGQAEAAFRHESAGSPAIARQEGESGSGS
jgi:hypothetical protein